MSEACLDIFHDVWHHFSNDFGNHLRSHLLDQLRAVKLQGFSLAPLVILALLPGEGRLKTLNGLVDEPDNKNLNYMVTC